MLDISLSNKLTASVSETFCLLRGTQKESFAKPCVTGNVVIPAKAGIQCYQVLSGFRVKPGMTEGGIIQSSQKN